MLLGVPNFSEGRDAGLVERLTAQFSRGAELLDSHSDEVHNRTVLTLAAHPKSLGEALSRGAGACAMTIDVFAHDGAHPRIGALDVCPLVFLDDAGREPARDTALAVARTLGGEGIPVFLYGELASSEERRERAFFREGGPQRLRERMGSGELRADFGPDRPHPRAGGTLLTARPPLAAFNLELDGEGGGDLLGAARSVAAALRESAGGLPGVRAIAIDLGGGRAQVSTNVHDPVAVPLAEVVEQARALAVQSGASIAAAEIVGLVPEAALAHFPDEVPIPGFDPALGVIERRLAESPS
jgi:glutamate formiminotransferase/glutamate formiminotransferase/formiminotetrahydrofolate cyclodeaminase